MDETMDGTRTEAAGGWQVRKIGVIGAGIVGVPMAALLAEAGVRIGTDRPASVVIVQRPSATSGWKVGAINAGRSPIGGIEPDLDRIVRDAAAEGRLRAASDCAEIADADAVLICVQTDKKVLGPDYGPLSEAVASLAAALRTRPAGPPPLIVFESTLAPTTMRTWAAGMFARFGLREGRDILLGHSPNRVMPGRLVERIRSADKIAGGLTPAATQRIQALYSGVTAEGRLHATNALTAEIVKTLENAYRDVRIAYSAEVARWCDAADVDFHRVRTAVNGRLAREAELPPDAPAAALGLLTPTIGVGGHCLPNDGILLLWRLIESGADVSESLILEARRINDESPAATAVRLEEAFGGLRNRTLALMGTAYRPDSEDTRNSPTLVLARILSERGSRVILHDPYVNPGDANLVRSGLAGRFTRDPEEALGPADIVVFCAAHATYRDLPSALLAPRGATRTIFDGCGLTGPWTGKSGPAEVPGIGKGRNGPPAGFPDFVQAGFRAVELGVANETAALIEFLNARYAPGEFDKADFPTVQRLAATCITGCRIVDPGPVAAPPLFEGFSSRLVRRARAASAGKAAARERA
jgi:UDP-N-acetyl-D-mannosaminuronic acid dehydrogenase